MDQYELQKQNKSEHLDKKLKTKRWEHNFSP